MDQKNGLTSTANLLKPANFVPFARERAALTQFLATGEFSRSPNLEKILVYLCEQYFQGQSNAVKEYSIATEALGRSEDFDPKKDSIVRVEMHRLRRRLREYRQGKGQMDSAWIDIPEKTYTPEFQFREIPAPALALSAAIPDAPLAPPPTPPPARTVWIARPERNLAPLYLGLFLAAALATGWFVFRPKPLPQVFPATLVSTSNEEFADVSSNPKFGPDEEVRILAGRTGARFVDRYGQAWLPDRFFTGGSAIPVGKEVHSRGLDPNLFASYREGDFQYDIPLPDRPYELTLYFAETTFGEGNPLGGGESSRQFHLHINGNMVLQNFDVIADANDSNTMTARTFKDVRPAADGKLHLRFQSSLAAKAFVNAIHLRPGLDGALRPIRIVCRPQQFRDAKGNLWQPDMYYRGGQQITRPMGAPVPVDTDLYRGERYGRFSYRIPVAPGRYTLKLYFWEYWWGPDHPGKGGSNSRIFDVFANFQPLLRDFDIIAQTSQDQWTVRTFPGVEPNNEGKIALDFVPKINYAMVNAIEILDESLLTK